MENLFQTLTPFMAIIGMFVVMLAVVFIAIFAIMLVLLGILSIVNFIECYPSYRRLKRLERMATEIALMRLKIYSNISKVRILRESFDTKILESSTTNIDAIITYRNLLAKVEDRLCGLV